MSSSVPSAAELRRRAEQSARDKAASRGGRGKGKRGRGGRNPAPARATGLSLGVSLLLEGDKSKILRLFNNDDPKWSVSHTNYRVASVSVEVLPLVIAAPHVSGLLQMKILQSPPPSNFDGASLMGQAHVVSVPWGETKTVQIPVPPPHQETGQLGFALVCASNVNYWSADDSTGKSVPGACFSLRVNMRASSVQEEW